MGPIECPHCHQMLEDRIIPITPRPINLLLFADADHVAPQDVIIWKTFQGVIVPTTLFEMFGPHHDNAVTHLLRNLDLLGQQHQRADIKVRRTT